MSAKMTKWTPRPKSPAVSNTTTSPKTTQPTLAALQDSTNQQQHNNIRGRFQQDHNPIIPENSASDQQVQNRLLVQVSNNNNNQNDDDQEEQTQPNPPRGLKFGESFEFFFKCTVHLNPSGHVILKISNSRVNTSKILMPGDDMSVILDAAKNQLHKEMEKLIPRPPGSIDLYNAAKNDSKVLDPLNRARFGNYKVDSNKSAPNPKSFFYRCPNNDCQQRWPNPSHSLQTIPCKSCKKASLEAIFTTGADDLSNGKMNENTYNFAFGKDNNPPAKCWNNPKQKIVYVKDRHKYLRNGREWTCNCENGTKVQNYKDPQTGEISVNQYPCSVCNFFPPFFSQEDVFRNLANKEKEAYEKVRQEQFLIDNFCS